MGIDTSKVNQKLSFAAGETLFEENKASNSLNLVHEGGLIFEKNTSGGPVFLYQVEGANLTPGIISLFTNGRYPYTIKAAKNGSISTYAINQTNINKTITSKTSLGFMIARSLLKEIVELYKKANQITLFNSQLEMYVDNLSLLYYLINPQVFPDIVDNKVNPPGDEITDATLRLTRVNLMNFFERGGSFPESPSKKFLNEDHRSLLQKEYPEELEFENQEFLFIRKILSINPKIQNAMFEADPSLLVYICEKLSTVKSELLEEVNDAIDNAENNCKLFLGGDDSYLEKYFLVLDLTASRMSNIAPQNIYQITENISEKMDKFAMQFKSLFGRGFSNYSPNIKNFKDKSKQLASENKQEPEKPHTSAITSGIDMGAVKKELENSTGKILTYAGITPDQMKEFSALMIKLKQLSNPLDPEPDIRKIRKNIGKIYWDIYQKSFIKYTTTKQAPKSVELMLKYGFMDETLLDDEHIAFLYTHENPSKKEYQVPVWDGIEWLEKIYSKKFVTSLDELGQTYFEKIKNDLKDPAIKKETDLPANLDTSEARLKSELSSMYEANVRLTSGSPSTHLPILTRYQISSPLENCVMTKDKINQIIGNILKIDFTAFDREVIYNNEELGIRKEFIHKNIIPDFILVPSIGSKVMMWQDLSVFRGSGAKESRGRIIVPNFIVGDPVTIITEAIGAFRWELCKNILGPDWNNVGIPSITADYTDYVQFFKKNKDLSIELKEKLASEFKRFRTDRDKFVNDYIIWLKYESEGVQRLNKVVRGMFYRHIPFSDEIREKVSKLPAFLDIHNRFKNIRTRQFKENENRYKKYINANGGLPAELEANLNFYKV